MPDGRFVSRSIAQSEQLGRVSFEADYLFTRCIPHLDRDGRMAGHPDLIKSVVCPLRPEIESALIPDLLRHLAGAGLLEWYEVEGRQVLWFPGFPNHQRGLKYDREAPSHYPARTSKEAVDLGRITSGPTPEQVRLSEVKLSEVKSKFKLSEVKGSPSATASENGKQPETWVQQAVVIWGKHQGAITHGKIGKLLKPLLATYPESEVLRRFRIFAEGEKARFGVAHFTEHFAAFEREPDFFIGPDGSRIPYIAEPVYPDWLDPAVLVPPKEVTP
jgi:hypothetical protein